MEGGARPFWTLYIMIAMVCSRRVWSVGDFALFKSSSYVEFLLQ